MKRNAPLPFALGGRFVRRVMIAVVAAGLGWIGLAAIPLRAAETEAKSVSLSGGLEDGKARLVIEALLNGRDPQKDRVIYSAQWEHAVQVSPENFRHTIQVTMDILNGVPREIPLKIQGAGVVEAVAGENLLDWSVRQEEAGARSLVLRPRPSEKPPTHWVVTVRAVQELKSWEKPEALLTLAAEQPVLSSGYVKIEPTPSLAVQPAAISGLVPLEARYLPASLRGTPAAGEAEPLAFRFQGTSYALSLSLALADPEWRRVVVQDSQLRGKWEEGQAEFTWQATVRVRQPRGAVLPLLSGGVALVSWEAPDGCRLKFDGNQYLLVLPKDGEFPLRMGFKAAVKSQDGWNAVEFRVAPSAVQPVTLSGLGPETQFEFAGAARPERAGEDFRSHLPPDGQVKLAWKEARAEAEGRLFYAVEMLSQVSVSPGLLREVSLLQYRIMQGELSRVEVGLLGEGEVTRVQGEHILTWKVEPAAQGAGRVISVQFNQPQKDALTLLVQVQRPLGAFPQAAEVPRLQPREATRFAGHVRVVNVGAVRLEVLEAGGLSQVSPEQFPESDLTKATMPVAGSQRFVFRFSSSDYALRLQADNILPELSVSEVVTYHLAEAEVDIEAEVELDIREAPVRELQLRVPRGFALARLNAAGVADSFLRETEGEPQAELRLVFGQPVTGRQVVQLRLERNQPLGETNWSLPRLEVVRAKSTRGHVGVSADGGFRLTPERTQGLTEIATAFFPRKAAGLQAAFRLSDPAWQAGLRVERLPQSIQADGFHLFSVGEGIAYGSSVINYVVSGAPMAAFRVEIAPEYSNVEFTGRDVRNWQKTDNGYLVQLHTPVSGPFTLLATYERPFQSKGETLAFTGARPVDAQTEQGHTVVISAFQFQVKPVRVSPGLLALESGELPPEYLLLFDAPILAAYRYTARPFDLQLALSPLAQFETQGQVVDRASVRTRISSEGQVITDISYYVKNRGQPHFRVTLPAGTELWSSTVNGSAAVPVKDGASHLIPLPQSLDANAVLRVELKLAARTSGARRLQVHTPAVGAPVMLAEWRLEPDTGRRLVWKGGSLTPAGGVVDDSGFAALARWLRGPDGKDVARKAMVLAALLGLALGVWRWTSGPGVYRHTARHWAGLSVGLLALVLALINGAALISAALPIQVAVPPTLTLLAPVQQAGSALQVDLANLPVPTSTSTSVRALWPLLLAVLIWMASAFPRVNRWRPLDRALGWTLCGWAALHLPEGVPVFLAMVGLFAAMELVWPAWQRLWQAAPRPQDPSAPSSTAGAAPAVVALLAAGFLGSAGTKAWAGEAPDLQALTETPSALAVLQKIRVEDRYVLAEAKIKWQASKGQLLPVLFEPAVLTELASATNGLKWVDVPANGRAARQLLALETRTFEVVLRYQAPVNPAGVQRAEGESGFLLPTQPGLINQVELSLPNLDVDVVSPQATAIQRSGTGTNTVALLTLEPKAGAWIGWRPRSRDVRKEKPIFYAENTQLYVPAPGVIEGVHVVAIRPAQGELAELQFQVPAGSTITDVAELGSGSGGKGGANLTVSLWRFDPDTRRLRVTLAPAQSRPFALQIRSQTPTGPLPVEKSVGLLSTLQATGEIGLLGVATGSEIQLDAVQSELLSPINLEDFPGAVAAPLQAMIPNLTVRRAYRYAEARTTATIKASAVEADVRVEAQDTLSLGEDRTLLASILSVDILRAGIFRLSFVLPNGFDVEAVTGEALSHWTELKTDAGRVITLHLKGRTEGRQVFNVTLTGAGVKAVPKWTAPRLVLREASKQRGTYVVVPEQGLRLQVATREGLTQLDPQKSGIRQKGVLAFRVLQTPWQLVLELEAVDPVIQVTGLQQAVIGEALAKFTTGLQYQIENTGVKSFRVLLPTNAESVHFTGDQVADFLPVATNAVAGMQEWEVKLHRRVIGRYQLQAAYQMVLPAGTTQASIHGVQALGVNLQRGFVTVQASGRLQVRVAQPPPALQPAEWQNIPRGLLLDIQAASAHFTFRLVEPAFTLPLTIERHEPARLLPARVNDVTFRSVVADDGAMLTQAILHLVPGDKRLLQVTLPQGARFWFAFVNQNGVLPWREQDRVLIPLEQLSGPGRALSVEIFYGSQAGTGNSRSLDLQLLAPKFDLPLENIRWSVYLNEKWRLRDWSGALQLEEQKDVERPVAVNVENYLQAEASWQQAKTKSAEEMLATGNRLLEEGDPQQARRAFQAAYGLSQHDNAFNEDARVQLHTLKLEQAVVGLNARQSAVEGDTGALSGKFRELRSRKNLNYTKQDAKEILENNRADDKAAFLRLAERLIQQQDAVVINTASIRASIPEQGRLLTFARTVQVDPTSDLRLQVRATAVRAASGVFRLAFLAVMFAFLLALVWLARRALGPVPAQA